MDSNNLPRETADATLLAGARELGPEELCQFVAGRGEAEREKSPETIVALGHADADTTSADGGKGSGEWKKTFEKTVEREFEKSPPHKSDPDWAWSEFKTDKPGKTDDQKNAEKKPEEKKSFDGKGKLGAEFSFDKDTKSVSKTISDGKGGTVDLSGKQEREKVVSVETEVSKNGLSVKAGAETRGEVSGKVNAEKKLGSGVSVSNESEGTAKGSAGAKGTIDIGKGNIAIKAEVGAKGEVGVKNTVQIKDSLGSSTFENKHKLAGEAKAEAGIENGTAKVKVSAEIKNENEVAAKRTIKVGGAELEGKSSLNNQNKAAAEAEVKFGKEGVKAKAEVGAEAKVSAETGGKVKFGGDKEIGTKANVTAKVYAKAGGEAGVTKEGAKFKGSAELGASVQAGSESKYAEGKNAVTAGVAAEFGKKVAAGGSAEATVKDGVATISVSLKGTLIIGLEVKLKVDYDTKQVQAAVSKALEAVKSEWAEYERKAAKTADGQIDLAGEKVKSSAKLVEAFGKNLILEGNKQGGLFGAVNVVGGHAAQQAGLIGKNVAVKEGVAIITDIGVEAAKQGNKVGDALDKSEMAKDVKNALKPLTQLPDILKPPGQPPPYLDATKRLEKILQEQQEKEKADRAAKAAEEQDRAFKRLSIQHKNHIEVPTVKDVVKPVARSIGDGATTVVQKISSAWTFFKSIFRR